MEVVRISHIWVSHFQDSEEENHEAQDGVLLLTSGGLTNDDLTKLNMLICWLQLDSDGFIVDILVGGHFLFSTIYIYMG